MRHDASHLVTRRRFVIDAAVTVGALGLHSPASRWTRFGRPEDGRFTARPVPAPSDLLQHGLHTLATSNGRETIVLVPATVTIGRPAPLLLAFHGATMSVAESLDANTDAVTQAGVILVAPSSEGITWDAIRGGYGVDLQRADDAISHVFHHCAVDPRHVAISGFSDGATYAISVGLVNGDLFTHIIAHSAGFIIPGERHGRPAAFIAHGTRDQILPIERCGRHIATELAHDGYNVQFVEFDGGHQIRAENVQRAMRWFVG
jgi:phospholipase/carboxylesterase